MAVISISLPQDLLSDVEEKVEEHGYAGRSDLTREALRDFVRGFDSGNEGEVVATLTVLFREGSEVEREIPSLRHEYGDSVLDRSHSCVGEGRCLEVIVVEADTGKVSEILGRLRSKDGVLSTDYTAESVEELR